MREPPPRDPGESDDAAVAGGADHESSAGTVSEVLRRLAGRTASFGRYAVREEIGRGGQGAVMVVTDSDLRRQLAMKVSHGWGGAAAPRADSDSLGRFLEEAQVTGQLEHPGIVPVHELGVDPEGRVYFTMQLVKGRDLRSVFDLVHAEREGWSRTRALGVLLRVCEAMAYAHSKGVIHRDLKPANVMVGKYGEVYVMDWGLARLAGEEDRHDLRLDVELSSLAIETDRHQESESDSALVTMDGAVVGTPVYMSPEQARGQTDDLDARTDVYALGAMLYHLLAGEMPYVPAGARVSPRTVLLAVLNGPPKPLGEIRRDVPAELAAICEKAMSRERGARYADMAELAEDLRAYLEHRVVRAYQTGAVAELGKWVERNRGLAVTAAGALVVLVVSTALYLRDLQSYATELNASNTALDERERSVRAVALASASSEALQQDAMLALLLAREAVGIQRTPQTIARLHDAVASSRERALYRAGPGAFTFGATAAPQGDLIVTAAGSAVVLLDPDGSEVERLEGHGGSICALRCSPDGDRILSGSLDDTARLWDLEGGEPVALRHQNNVRVVEFSPDGETALTGSIDGFVRLWRMDGSMIDEMSHDSPVLDASFSPDGRRVLSACADGLVRVWEFSTEASGVRHLRDLAGHEGQVSSADFSPAGDRIVTVSGPSIWNNPEVYDGAVRLWDLSRGESMVLAQGAVWAGFAPHGESILVLSEDGTVRTWSTEGDPLNSGKAPETSAPWSAAFSPRGDEFAVGFSDGSAWVFDGACRVVAGLKGHETEVFSTGFSRDGRSVVTSSLDGTVRFWDVSVPGFPEFRGHGGAVLSVSAHGSLVATAGTDRTVRLWSSEGEELAVLRGHRGHVHSALFSPDGQFVLTASRDRTARLWNLAGEGLGVPFAHALAEDGRDHDVRMAAFSPDGERVATVTRSQWVRVWSREGEVLSRFRESGWLSDIAFSADGERLLYGRGSSACISTPEGRVLVELRGHGGRVRSVEYSPDGARVLTASLDTTARLWEGSSGELIRELAGHQGGLNQASFSPDGERVVTASEDGTARIWSLEGETLAILRGDGSGLTGAVFTPDGKGVLTSAWNGTVRAWRADPDEVEQLAALRAHRDFSEDELLIHGALLDLPVRRAVALYDELILKERVRAHLAESPDLGADLRRTLGILIESRPDPTVGDLVQRVWAAVRERDQAPEVYARALYEIETAGELAAAADPFVATNRGVALLRKGRLREARESLILGDRLNRELLQPAFNPAYSSVFLAMVNARLGDAERAAALLEESRAQVRAEENESAARELADLLREAEELIGED